MELQGVSVENECSVKEVCEQQQHGATKEKGKWPRLPVQDAICQRVEQRREDGSQYECKRHASLHMFLGHPRER